VTASRKPVAASSNGLSSTCRKPRREYFHTTGVWQMVVKPKAQAIQNMGDEFRRPILSMLAEIDHKKATISM
jgi:hypothetical protein